LVTGNQDLVLACHAKSWCNVAGDCIEKSSKGSVSVVLNTFVLGVGLQICCAVAYMTLMILEKVSDVDCRSLRFSDLSAFFFVHDEMLASVITFRINPGLLFFYTFYGEQSSIL